MTLAEMRLADLTRDPRCQSRVEMSSEYAEELADFLLSRDDEGRLRQLPPVVAFRAAGTRAPTWLADGWHRYEAHGLAGRKTILVDVRTGTLRDAVLFAVGANSRHGKRPTPADVRRAVLTLLEDEEWGQWSAREVARRVGCGKRTVDRLKESLCGAENRMGGGTVKARRGGTVYTMTFRSMSPAEQREAVEAETEDCRPEWRQEVRDGLEQAERAAVALGETHCDVVVHIRDALAELRWVEKAEADRRRA